MAMLVFCNLGNYVKGRLTEVLDTNAPRSYMESMQKWIAEGNSPETWHRKTSIVFITDKTKEDMLYLLEEDASGNRVYAHIEPPVGSEHYNSLLNTGEVHITYSEYLAYEVLA